MHVRNEVVEWSVVARLKGLSPVAGCGTGASARVGGGGRVCTLCVIFFFFSSRRRHTRCSRDWSSDVCSSDLRTVSFPRGLRGNHSRKHTLCALFPWRPRSRLTILRNRPRALESETC